MICCLNPNCSKPSNPDKAKICQSCGEPLTVMLRGRYSPIKLLGHGGFGRTYLAQDRDRLNANCVIKQFSPQVKGNKSIDKAIQLFNQEAVRLNELGEHPQIPALLAYFEDNEYLYLVQQYIEGQNLFQELHHEGMFSEEKVRDILLSLLPVLQFIHDRQVIHRDITPMNILRRQSDHRLMLIDFGVAKQLSADLSEQAGTRIGTEGYSPIEQFRGGRAYPASDIYSLGATSIHLLTKVRPENLYDPLSGEWVWQQRLSDKGIRVSDQLAQVLNRMLKDLVNERYQSADAVLQDLQANVSQVPVGYPGGDRPSHPSSRSSSSSGSLSGYPPPSRSSQSGQRMSSPNGLRHSSNGRSQPDGSQSPAPFSKAPSSQPSVSRQPRSQQPRSQQPRSQQPTSRPSPSRPRTSRPSTSDAPTRTSSGYRSRYCRCVYTINGHSSWVTDVAMSPVTNTFATSSLDDTVKLWNLQTGELMVTMEGHERGTNKVLFSPDGTLLLSAGDDHRIKIWDAFSGQLIQTLTGHMRDVTALAVSPDGQFLLTGGEDRSIRVWQLPSGKLVKTPFGVMSMVKALCATPNGQFFASAGLDKVVRLWSMQTAERVMELSGHSGSIHALSVSPNSQVLASAGKDRTIRLWKLPDGTPFHTLQGHSRDVNAVAVMPDGRLLLSGSSDKTIRLWDMPTGNLLDTLTDHLDAVSAIAVHHDKKTFVSCSSDKTIKVWRIRTR
ncbi:MAG: protein kinase [Leptolyngbyaceae bacterium]|nr:protein kinase [Leptolyngbyaceae bacterium]